MDLNITKSPRTSRQSSAGVPPARRAIQRRRVAGFAGGSSRVACPTLLAVILFTTVLALASERAPETWQSPPNPRPPGLPRLSPLLTDAKGNPIATRRAWLRQHDAFKKQWHEFMGGFPKRKAPLKAEFLDKEDLPDFTRQYVRYQIEDGVFTDGYLLTPKHTRGKLPAIVVFHPTTPLQARGVAGLAPGYAEEKWHGTQLVRRGYIVLCPRNFIFDDSEFSGARQYVANVARVRERHPDWTGMARMTWDAVRAADFLESLPNVDAKRIGCLGHSLGAKVALYAGAFEERYKAVVSSEGGIGLRFSNWDAVWYLGPRIKAPGFPLENHQVLALTAPRAFLLLAGESADTDKSWAFIEAVTPLYQLLGAPQNIGWFNHRLGHRYAPEARELAEEFLDRHLNPAP